MSFSACEVGIKCTSESYLQNKDKHEHAVVLLEIATSIGVNWGSGDSFRSVLESVRESSLYVPY